jgi:hypothetical protein
MTISRWIVLGLLMVVLAVLLVIGVWRGPFDCGRAGREERQEAVLAWLECVECIDGEREAVVAQRGCPVPALTDALLNGPGPGRVANVRRKLELSSTPVGTVTRGQLVQIGVEGYTATYRVRAAIALTDLTLAGVKAAGEALAAARDSADAGTRTFPREVLGVLGSAGATTTVPRFAGLVTPDPADFLDTVTVRLPQGEVVEDEDVRLAGSPFGDDVLVDRFPGSDSLRFVAVGHAATYVIEVSGLGDAGDSAWAPFSIARMPRRPQGLSAQVPIPAGPAFRHYFAVRDTAEQLRFAPAAAVSLTMSLEWADSVGARLVVRECGVPHAVAPLPMDPQRRVRGRVVDETGTPIAGATVGVAGAAGGDAVSGSDGAFAIPLPPGPDTARVDVTHPRYEGGVFVLPMGLGDVTLGLRTRARAAAPGALRRIGVESAPVPAGCWLLGVERLGPPEDSSPTIFRFRATAVPLVP